MKILLYGSGKTASKLIENTKYITNIEILACLDSNKDKKDTLCNGLKVDFADNIIFYDFDFVLIASIYQDEIRNILEEKYKVNINKIICNANEWVEDKLIQQEFFKYYNFNKKESCCIRNEKIVIYTALFGDYDKLSSPLYVDEHVDYICFTDNKNLKSDIWRIYCFDKDNDEDFCRTAKKFKILPHLFLQDYEISIWIDASVQIKKSMMKMMKEQFGKSNLLFFPHINRTCTYDEAKICLVERLDNEEVIKCQMKRYSGEAFPKDYGLIAAGVMIRRHMELDVIALMEMWWNEISIGSKRDQISLMYCLWKRKIKYDLANIDILKNQYFEVRPHLQQ